MGRSWFGGGALNPFILAAAVFLVVLLSNVEAYPVEDLVVNLPGQPKVGFRQFAGYIDIDVKTGKSLFYYFVEADSTPLSKPLSLWLNGGPGCSSIGGGAFTELGPFYPRGDARSLRINRMSWNRASNLLFVESPAGVGWSYSNTSSDYKTGDAATAMDMRIFLLNWLAKFPEYKSLPFFLTGESYAGHYIPQLADLLLEHNAHSKGFKFNLKGVAIGNPLLNLDQDAGSPYEFLWSHGMMSDELHQTITKECDFDDYTFENPHNESDSCNDALSTAMDIVGNYVNNYDVLLDVCYPSIFEQELRLKKLKALHANRTGLPYPWSMCSSELEYQDTDGNIDILPVLKKIIQNGIPVWIFSGDQDSVVPLMGSRTLVRQLADDLKFKVTVPYSTWFHKNQVAGWVTEYGNMLTFATVRGAAHMVPYAQPSRALHLFSAFLRGKRLPDHPKISE
ncbi:unnamed protein product [Linum tenue]|uniref:Carboxypeptidase n=1 Tax=Linum tenue TaxID=586396 RepID=A0AAV0IFQ2_9ROSI|nr:unnamed protein product [Linum tenue]